MHQALPQRLFLLETAGERGALQVLDDISLQVAEGDRVEAGQAVATIEAMKMEAAITSPVAGTVQRRAIPTTQQCEAGDLLVVVG